MDSKKLNNLNFKNRDLIVLFVQKWNDLDTTASAVALCQMLRESNPKCPCYVVGFTGSSNFINVKPYILPDLDLGTILQNSKNSLAILLEIVEANHLHNPSLLSSFKDIAIIDHHEVKEDTKNGSEDINEKITAIVRRPEYSSCCELIWDLCPEVEGGKRSQTIGEQLFFGLYSDNQELISTHTNANTFRILSEMMEMGIDVPGLIRKMHQGDFIYVQLFGRLMGRAKQNENLIVMNLLADDVHELMPWCFYKEKSGKVRQKKMFTYTINMARRTIKANTYVLFHYSLFAPGSKEKKMIFVVLDKPNEALENVLRANKFHKNRNRGTKNGNFVDAMAFIRKYLDLFSL